MNGRPFDKLRANVGIKLLTDFAHALVPNYSKAKVGCAFAGWRVSVWESRRSALALDCSTARQHCLTSSVR